METFIYIIKSITILSIFYIIYRIVLQKDTFFTANRHYLLAGIIAALVFPFLEYTKITYKDIPSITVPILEETPYIATSEEIAQLQPESITIDWWQIALILYAIGVGIMLIRLLVQLLSLNKLISAYPKTKKHGFTYVQITDKAITPFSFFKTICYNPNLHSSEELDMILAHEKIHVRQKHTIDVLLTQCVLAIQWLNPFAWLYKKSLEQNLEFIADNGAIQEVTSSKEYQRTLVKVSSTVMQPALTNNFYHSLIKKRIVMLNKQTSRKRNLWKLGLVLPALALFMYSFNVKEVIKYREIPNTSTSESHKTHSDALNASLEEELYSDTDHANTAKISTHEAVATPSSDQKQFTITNTTTDAYLETIENHFANTYKSTLVKFAKVNHIGGKLVGFDFQTKMADDTRFITRFSVNHADHFKPFNLIAIDEHEILMADIEGTKLKFTPEKSITQYNFKEEVIGENPVLVINNKIIHPNANAITYKTDKEVSHLMPSKAMALYGSVAKDGAIVINDPNYTTTVNGKHLRASIDTEHSNKHTTPTFKIRITKNTTDKELKDIKKDLKENYDINLNYSTTRNNSGEITAISISYSGNGKNGNYSVNGNDPIEEFYFFMEEDGKSGFWSEKHEERRLHREERRAEMGKRRELMQKERELKRAELEKLREELRSIQNDHGKEAEKRKKELEKRLLKQQKHLAERQKEMEMRKAELEQHRLERKEEMKAHKEEMKRHMQERKEEMKMHQEEMKMRQKEMREHVVRGRRHHANNITITKDSTDEEIKAISSKLKSEGITFSLSKIKRNSEGEITSYKMKFNNHKGTESTSQRKTNNDSPIEPLHIVYSENNIEVHN